MRRVGRVPTSRWLAVAVLCAAVGCGLKGGIRHTVAPGDSLYRIGLAYGVDYRELARVNGIDDPDQLEVGQTLLIPDAKRRLPVEVITPAARSDRRPRALPAGLRFQWPLEIGRVTSRFGPRRDVHHDGIDISAPRGTPVRAAADGRVLYSDRLRGYGNLVIVDHGAGFATVYAHNTRNDVSAGERVGSGQVIATVGETGQTSGPHLHFEVREDNVARDPLAYVPAHGGRDQRAGRGER
jgi:murein DD-endopeptidase MepM/ murein hydrolase activator NlpD